MASKGPKICLAMSLLFLIVTSVLVPLFIIIFKPKDPIITIHPTGLENLEISNLTGNVSLGMIITVKNLNLESFEYKNSTGYIYFHDRIIGYVPMRADFVPALGQINVNTSAILVMPKLLNCTMLLPDFKSGTLNFTSTTTLPGKTQLLKIIKLKAIAYSTSHIPYSKL